MKFDELNIHPALLKTIEGLGFEEMTPIQEKCLRDIHLGKDVVGQAETGSGKTLAFCLPILDRINVRGGLQALILTPTRELCVQLTEVFKQFGDQLGVRSVSVFGGVSIEPQIRELRHAHVVVGTPGRILDHMRRRTIDFRDVRFLVLDETDKMFEMGFIEDVEQIINEVPKHRQTLMFSATISHEIYKVTNRHLRNPLVVRTQSYVDKSKLRQIYYDIYQQNNKFSLLLHLLKNNTPGLAIVFCATQRETDLVARNLRHQGIHASAIHGGMSQNKRLQSLDSLKNQTTDVLVATDVAARGLDIKNVTHVYNYDVPKTSKEYVHRIGRTARAGENGDAVTLLTDRDHDNFRRVQDDEELNIELAEMPQFRKVPFIRRSQNEGRQFHGKPRQFHGHPKHHSQGNRGQYPHR
ncbi:MAG TPA: DEAD/DEAH box helicase [Candidatus Thermoplasmatota archaeon]|nr:DEAD/DEAH box helicase [Candidatus Thermoplasmatota archaeon]